MIKIRYADLPGGLHARAEARGRHTVIIYLLPGLTVAQRRAVLRRLRSSARVGHGPLLSRAGMARAMAADRIRTNLRNATAALRVHPAILAPPLLLTVAAAVAFVLLVPVPVGINANPPSNPGAAYRQPSHGQTRPQPNGGGKPLIPPGRHSRVDDPNRWVQLAARPSLLAPPPHYRPPKPPRTPRPAASRTRSPSASPSPTPSPSASAPSAPSAAPSPSAGPAPAPSGSGRLCVNLIVTGVCL